MSSRPWPDLTPGPFGSLRAWWNRNRAQPDEYAFVPASTTHQHQFESPLPSAVYGLDFQVKMTIHWRLDLTSGARHSSPRSAAVNDIIQRARALTERTMLVHHVPLQHQLGDELAAERQVDGTHVWARADGVSLSVADGDLAVARKHIELLQNTAVRQAERDAERAEMKYLREEVLSDLSSATVWWLTRNGYQVEQAVALSRHLAELVEIAADRRERHWADALVTSFESALPRLDDGNRADVRVHLAKALGMYGGANVAAEFAEQVGLPAHHHEHHELPRSNGAHHANGSHHANGAKPLP